MDRCKHEFGCHSCVSALEALDKAIIEYFENRTKENQEKVEERMEFVQQTIEFIMNVRGE